MCLITNVNQTLYYIITQIVQKKSITQNITLKEIEELVLKSKTADFST